LKVKGRTSAFVVKRQGEIVKIVFVASEGVPFSKTGGLADVVGALPKALAATGHEVHVILPRYRMTNPGPVLPDGQSVTVPLASGLRFVSIQSGGEGSGVRHCLVDFPEFFDRQGLYQENGQDYPDNPVRFGAFSMAALEFMKRSTTPPDVIHCHDWQTALVPIYLHSLYKSDRFFEKPSVVFTIHNLGYQGLFPPEVLPQLTLDSGLLTVDGLEFFGKVNLLKGAIIFSDFITTVSPTYAKEIQTAEFGFGLEGVLKQRADRLRGIVNGVDYEAWDPATDKLIPANYSPENMKGKMLCKKALLEKMGARQPVLNRPVIGIVSRFDRQKGFDLIADAADQLMTMSLYIVALGTGDPAYEELFRGLAARHPDKFLVKVAYDNALAHQIEAGADIFLMPSRYEPCGLNQIYSMKYSTVPVVRATGGLDDTVQPFDGRAGTGFKFHRYSPDALLSAIRQAVETYHRPSAWGQLMHNCMRQDFSWPVSAAEYLKIYEEQRSAKLESVGARETANAGEKPEAQTAGV
jgi:starch synthase